MDVTQEHSGAGDGASPSKGTEDAVTPACLQSDLDGELIIERLLSRREGSARVVAEP